MSSSRDANESAKDVDEAVAVLQSCIPPLVEGTREAVALLLADPRPGDPVLLAIGWVARNAALFFGVAGGLACLTIAETKGLTDEYIAAEYGSQGFIETVMNLEEFREEVLSSLAEANRRYGLLGVEGGTWPKIMQALATVRLTLAAHHGNRELDVLEELIEPFVLRQTQRDREDLMESVAAELQDDFEKLIESEPLCKMVQAAATRARRSLKKRGRQDVRQKELAWIGRRLLYRDFVQKELRGKSRTQRARKGQMWRLRDFCKQLHFRILDEMRKDGRTQRLRNTDPRRRDPKSTEEAFDEKSLTSWRDEGRQGQRWWDVVYSDRRRFSQASQELARAAQGIFGAGQKPTQVRIAHAIAVSQPTVSRRLAEIRRIIAQIRKN